MLTLSVIKVNFCNYIKKKKQKSQYIQQLIKTLKKKQKQTKTTITIQNCLYQDKNSPKQSGDSSSFILVFLTLYFLSQLSGIYLNDVRTNIKIKKKRKIN